MLEAIAQKQNSMRAGCKVVLAQDYAAALCAVAAKVDPASGPVAKAVAFADRVVSAVEVDVSVRQLDLVVPFFLACSSSPEAPAPSALAAVHALGCVLYANAERASKWYDSVSDALAPFATGTSRFKAGSEGVALSQAALVCLGNLAAKAGPRWHTQHATALPLVLDVLARARTPPLRFAHCSDDAMARLISAALRLLLCLFQAAAPAVVEQALRRSDELLPLLHGLCTYGWPLPLSAATPSLGLGGRTSVGSGGSGAGHARVAPVPAAATAAAVSQSGPAAEVGGSGRPSLAAPPRQWAALVAQPPSAAVAAEGRGSAAVTEPEQVALGGLPEPPPPAARGPRSTGKHGGAVGGRVFGTGSSWYTDSDSDDDWGRDVGVGGGGGWNRGGGSGRASAAAPEKPRRIPLRVRATALHCLQVMAKQDARLVAGRWALFVPEVQVRGRGGQPTIGTPVIHGAVVCRAGVPRGSVPAVRVDCALVRPVDPCARRCGCGARCPAPGARSQEAWASTAGNSFTKQAFRPSPSFSLCRPLRWRSGSRWLTPLLTLLSVLPLEGEALVAVDTRA